MKNSYKFAICAVTVGLVFFPELLQAAQSIDAATINDAAAMASDTAEILAKSASDTVTASGTPILEQFLGGNAKYWLGTLGGGGIAGLAVGYTLKKVAKVVAIILGIAFISLQYLAYKELITIDWDKIKGSVNEQQLEQSAQGLMSILTYNLPFAGSFLVGFWIGFKKG